MLKGLTMIHYDALWIGVKPCTVQLISVLAESVSISYKSEVMLLHWFNKEITCV
jgi:hypothetical protein